jgi:Uma2 family endonuclease
MRAVGIRFYGRGGPTMATAEKDARKEPDESYNIETRKAYPDLVIKVVFTSGGVDKLEIYRRLGVREVWFWEEGVLANGVLAIYELQDDGYSKISASSLLPQLPIDTFLRYVSYYDQYDAVTEFLAEIEK